MNNIDKQYVLLAYVLLNEKRLQIKHILYNQIKQQMGEQVKPK